MLKNLSEVKTSQRSEKDGLLVSSRDGVPTVVSYPAGSGKTEMALRGCLEQVPFLRIEKVETQPLDEGRPDMVAVIDAPSGNQILVVQAKMSGQPRHAREAINQLYRHREAFPGSYGILVAPYISSQTAVLCEEEGIGYVDLAGNCRLCFDQVYIRQEGKPNPFSQKRELRSLYAPKAERVLRGLLFAPGRSWKLKALAAEVAVSLGQTHNVKELLLDREWARMDSDGLRLTDPESLLAEWAKNYDYRRNRPREFYSLKSLPEIEAAIAACSKAEGIRYALTGFSGAARCAPFVRYQRATAYVQDEIDRLAGLLGLKEVSSGSNLALIAPYDDGVFYGEREIDGVRVVSPVQNYLDVRSLRGRGAEAAAALLEQVIKPEW